MDYYIIYKTTNLLNGMMYIGKHKTNNIDDGYLGSGKWLKNSIRKHGVQNFRKEYLRFCESEEDMNYMERVFVDETWISRADTYNLKIGGEGGSSKKSTETLIRMSESAYRRHREHPFTLETKMKISASKTGRQLSNNHRENIKNHHYNTQGERNGFFGHHHSKESIDKISRKLKGRTPWNKGRKMKEI